jgi:hypothetical protein
MGRRCFPTLLVLLAVTCLPQPASATRSSAIGGLRANTETSCRLAVKAIHHGHLVQGRFRTKHWICRRQGGLGSEVGGERVKCRRGTDEAFEFAWATRGG